MLYIPWIVILDDHSVKKIRFENFGFGAVEGEKLHKQVVYESLGTPPPPALPGTQFPNKVKNT